VCGVINNACGAKYRDFRSSGIIGSQAPIVRHTRNSKCFALTDEFSCFTCALLPEPLGSYFTGAPLTLVVLLMLGKTAIDAKVHLMFHGQAYFANQDRSPGKNAKSKEQNSV
jgi:hypothetical protein